jgi:mRNA interferase HigB
MRMISYGILRAFIRLDATAAEAMNRWYELAEEAGWKSLVDVRQTFPHCDPVTVASGNTVYVFNVGGNKWRIICAIHFDWGRLYILRVLTHRQYDRNQWLKDL